MAIRSGFSKGPWLGLVIVAVVTACAATDDATRGRGLVVPTDASDGGEATEGGLVFDVSPIDVQRVDGGVADSGGARVCASAETCDNGFDDNCDGRTDEGCACLPGATQRCFPGQPSLAGVGACAFGTQRCEGTGEFGMWSACAGAVAPTGEACDGADNDCDGVVDNGCECRAGDMRACYGGAAETRLIGLCRDGMQLCFPGPGGVGSAWGGCAGDTRPATEACDGADNDCNGTVDDGCGCTAGASRRCYGGPAATDGVGRCHGGTQACVAMAGSTAWGPCEMQALPNAELCDGVDNDCNGTVDDGCQCRPGETRGCYDGPMGTRGVAPCADGRQTCVAGAGGVGSAWGACTGQRVPATEACDDADNNCNGAVDEGCACRRAETRSCYTGPAGTSGVGPCRGGTQACAVAGGVAAWGACAGQVVPAAEACDDLDNDCNGVIDNGCACRRGQTRSCYAGPAGTAGVGACTAGTEACVITGTAAAWGACAGAVVPRPELCDRVDNNCDGRVDEGCDCTAGAVRSCYPGPAGTAGTGACRAGSQTCAAGAGGVGAAWGACAGAVIPSTETCNVADDNCDGRVDEGCACRPGATQSCYDGAAGTSGVGVCRPGAQTCVAGAGGVGSAWGACGAQTLPSGETCNMLDDNCNGAVDDGLSCSGPSVVCPAAVTAPAGSTVTLTATSTGGASFRWAVVSAPPGGAFTLGSATTPSTTFTSVIVGTYGLRFTATDAAGRTASCMTTVTMQGHGLRVELIWSAGDSANRVDLDLQVHNRLATTWAITTNNVNVCYWNNRGPEWDAAGAPDNPTLDVDNLIGAGPENVRVDAPPASQIYSVGAYFWEDARARRDIGTPVAVTVRIYCGDALAAPPFTRSLRAGDSSRPTSTNLANDFWRVARVQFTSAATCTVTPLNDVITGSAAQLGSP